MTVASHVHLVSQSERMNAFRATCECTGTTLEGSGGITPEPVMSHQKGWITSMSQYPLHEGEGWSWVYNRVSFVWDDIDVIKSIIPSLQGQFLYFPLLAQNSAWSLWWWVHTPLHKRVTLHSSAKHSAAFVNGWFFESIAINIPVSHKEPSPRSKDIETKQRDRARRGLFLLLINLYRSYER